VVWGDYLRSGVATLVEYDFECVQLLMASGRWELASEHALEGIGL